MEKKCSECGNSFICEEDTISCWCASLPKLSKEQISDSDCMCKKCLLKRYKKKILNIDQITNELFEEEYRYQWRNRH